MISLSFILSAAGAWLITRYAETLGLVDKPSQRSSHVQPTPKGGGIGILAAFIYASLTLGMHYTFWMPAFFLSLVSLVGDRIEVRPRLRLFAQLSAASLLLLGLSTSSMIHWFQGDASLLASILFFCFAAIFIVGTANFYNFMDGINGIAGITGVVAFGLLAFSALHSGADSSFVMLAVCIAFGCAGFLPFNIPQAKVFMGDVGSILLGFVFAELVVLLSNNFMDFVCLAALLFPFYADELTTMLVRLKDQENLSRPHRRHLYQLLANEMGIPHWKISAIYGIVQLVVGLSVLFVKPLGTVMVLLLLAVYFGGFILLSFKIRAQF